MYMCRCMYIHICVCLYIARLRLKSSLFSADAGNNWDITVIYGDKRLSNQYGRPFERH